MPTKAVTGLQYLDCGCFHHAKQRNACSIAKKHIYKNPQSMSKLPGHLCDRWPVANPGFVASWAARLTAVPFQSVKHLPPVIRECCLLPPTWIVWEVPKWLVTGLNWARAISCLPLGQDRVHLSTWQGGTKGTNAATWTIAWMARSATFLPIWPQYSFTPSASNPLPANGHSPWGGGQQPVEPCARNVLSETTR